MPNDMPIERAVEVVRDHVLHLAIHNKNPRLYDALMTLSSRRAALEAEVERLRGERSSLRWSIHRVHHTAKCSLERLRNLTKPDMMKVIGQTCVDLQKVVDESQSGSDALWSTDAAINPEEKV